MYMTVIRRLNCFDAPKIKKMISYLTDEDGEKFSRALSKDALLVLHNLLPLKYKFLPASYILLEQKEILGLVTVIPTRGNPYKINISRLIFQKNMYDVGKRLVEFVIARLGAKGATSFIVTVDQCHDELLNLFMHGCGFRQCSYENLWKLDNFKPTTDVKANFRYCQNSDAKENSSSAAAVSIVLTAVTVPAPKRFVSLSLSRLETIVPALIISEITPASPMGAPSSPLITGHAAPSRESGRPRLINAR